jgi:hypothetical protein
LYNNSVELVEAADHQIYRVLLALYLGPMRLRQLALPYIINP